MKTLLRTYFPMTCNILTVGHIKCLEKLIWQGDVVIGLLTAKALKGYKKELMPFKDREFILISLGYEVVPQDSLDPSENIRKYKCNAIASGDGWEKSELQAIKELRIKKINLRSGHKVHSSDIMKCKLAK